MPNISGLIDLIVTILLLVIMVMCGFAFLDLLFASIHKRISKKAKLHR